MTCRRSSRKATAEEMRKNCLCSKHRVQGGNSCTGDTNQASHTHKKKSNKYLQLEPHIKTVNIHTHTHKQTTTTKQKLTRIATISEQQKRMLTVIMTMQLPDYEYAGRSVAV